MQKESRHKRVINHPGYKHHDMYFKSPEAAEYFRRYLAEYWHEEAEIFELHPDGHSAAVCYAVAVEGTDNNNMLRYYHEAHAIEWAYQNSCRAVESGL